MKLVGKTPEGLTVWHGLYNTFQSIGLPMNMMISSLYHSHHGVFDWVEELVDMRVHGIDHDKSVRRLIDEIHDSSLPHDLQDGIVSTLEKLYTTEV